jgi:hypothetical protein
MISTGTSLITTLIGVFGSTGSGFAFLAQRCISASRVLCFLVCNEFN